MLLKKAEYKILKLFFSEKKIVIFFGFLSYIANSFLLIYITFFTGKIIDLVNKNGLNFKILLQSSKPLFYLFPAMLILGIITSFINLSISRDSQIFYRKLLFEKILRLPYLKQIKFHSAYLQSRWMGDSSSVTAFFGEHVFEMTKSLFVIIFGIVFAMILSFRFTLILLGFIFISLIMFSLISKFLIKKMQKYIEFSSTLSGKVNEVIQGFVELRVMGYIDSFKENVIRKIDSLADNYFHIQLKGVFLISLISILIKIGVFSMLFYFGKMYAAGNISIGQVISFVGLFFFVVSSTTQLGSRINALNQNVASLKRIYDLLDMEEDSIYRSKGNETGILAENIRSLNIDNITFKYPDASENVLEEITIGFNSGKIYAIVGKSGSGKSTLIKLILGILPLQDGSIRVNEKIVNNLNELTKKIGYLSQEPFFFKGSLRENIDPEKIYSTTEMAQGLHDCGLNIRDFELGFDFEVEEMAKNLSGGEKQRVALTRVLLKKPEILILDEPTSQVDNKTELIIAKTLRKFADHGGIVLMISHRTSSQEMADEIVLLEGLNKLQHKVTKPNIAECPAI